MFKRLGNLAYNPDEILYIYVDQACNQVEVMFKGGHTKQIPFSEVALNLTLDMILDEDKLMEEKKAQELEDRGL